MTVCTGNICRSPLAEAELRHRLPGEYSICSSGLSALVGSSAQETIRKLASRRGLDLEDHKGAQIDESMVLENDLILVMTTPQKVELEQRYPAARGRVFLLGRWGVGEIPDPYGGTEALYTAVGRQIRKAVNQWVDKLIAHSW